MAWHPNLLLTVSHPSVCPTGIGHTWMPYDHFLPGCLDAGLDVFLFNGL
jgi:fructose-specific phosphotransferase system component IIB